MDSVFDQGGWADDVEARAGDYRYAGWHIGGRWEERLSEWKGIGKYVLSCAPRGSVRIAQAGELLGCGETFY